MDSDEHSAGQRHQQVFFPPVYAQGQSAAAPVSSSSYLPRRPPPARASPSFGVYAEQLASYLQQSFLPSVLPTTQEYDAKEQTRRDLEALANQISPGAKLVPFGSIASGLSLRNADMDLCCFQPRGPGKSVRSASEMVEVLGALIREKTQISVTTLPRARIPIIKLSIPPSAAAPFGIACDIGFENRMALENTRLLLTYAMVDPRLRTMVLFIKVWAKRRKVNNPYLGTLSSYGYVLLVIFFLTNIRRPPVLPNLQLLPPPRDIPQEEREFEGKDIYFFDDLELLNRYWSCTNNDNVGDLLISFFQYFAREFRFNWDVISVRTEGGLLSKEAKGWLRDRQTEAESHAPFELNRLCIEDPFAHDYNVARTVTADGVYTIRGEFMRAARILVSRIDRIPSMIQELCEERADILYSAPAQSYNRRRSAPSPRIIPLNMANAAATVAAPIDFRLWAGGNPQGTMYPIRHPRSHQLNPTPFGLDESEEANSPTAKQQQQSQQVQQQPQSQSQAQQPPQEELVSPTSSSSSSSRNQRDQSLSQSQQNQQQSSYIPPNLLHPQLSSSTSSNQQQQPLFYLSPSTFAYQAYLQQQQQQQSQQPSSSSSSYNNSSNYHQSHHHHQHSHSHSHSSRHYSSHRGHHYNNHHHYHHPHHYNNHHYNRYYAQSSATPISSFAPSSSTSSSTNSTMRRRSQIIDNAVNSTRAKEQGPSSRLERRSSWDGSSTSTYPIMSLSASATSSNHHHTQDQTATAPASPSMVPHRNLIFGNFDHALTLSPNSATLPSPPAGDHNGGVGEHGASLSCPSRTMSGASNFVSSPTSSTSSMEKRDGDDEDDGEREEEAEESGGGEDDESRENKEKGMDSRKRQSRQNDNQNQSHSDDDETQRRHNHHYHHHNHHKNKNNIHHNTHMIRPDVHGETISFGAIQVVRRSRQGDIKMAEKLRRRARGSMESGSTTDNEDPVTGTTTMSTSTSARPMSPTSFTTMITKTQNGDEDINFVNVETEDNGVEDGDEETDDAKTNCDDNNNTKEVKEQQNETSNEEENENENENYGEEGNETKKKVVVVVVDGENNKNKDNEKEQKLRASNEKEPSLSLSPKDETSSSSSSTSTIKKNVSSTSLSSSSSKEKEKKGSSILSSSSTTLSNENGTIEQSQELQNNHLKHQKQKSASSLHSPSSSSSQIDSINSNSTSSSSINKNTRTPTSSSSSSPSPSPTSSRVEPKMNGVAV